MSTIDYFQRKLDDKHRLTIPVELRGEFAGGEVVVTRGFGNYLHLYPSDIWQQAMEPALAGDILDERIADLNVRFRTGKQTARLDAKQGRITIEPELLAHAGITTSVEAVRVGTYWRLSVPSAQN